MERANACWWNKKYMYILLIDGASERDNNPLAKACGFISSTISITYPYTMVLCRYSIWKIPVGYITNHIRCSCYIVSLSVVHICLNVKMNSMFTKRLWTVSCLTLVCLWRWMPYNVQNFMMQDSFFLAPPIKQNQHDHRINCVQLVFSIKYNMLSTFHSLVMETNQLATS